MLGTVVYLAMSGDATCRGIRSPRDGPVVMELTQGMNIAARSKLRGWGLGVSHQHFLQLLLLLTACSYVLLPTWVFKK